MTLNELRQTIESTKWFSRLGEPDFTREPGIVSLPSLEPWRNLTGILPNESVPPMIEAGMKRLPSMRDEPDPIHGDDLKTRIRAMGKGEELLRQSRTMSQIVLRALRDFDRPLLKVGAVDFTESARGAALYAVRHATYEVMLGEGAITVYGGQFGFAQ